MMRRLGANFVRTRATSSFAPVSAPPSNAGGSVPSRRNDVGNAIGGSTSTTPLAPLSDRMDGLTSLVGWDAHGFNVNGVHMRGSVLVFDTFSLLWNVTRVLDVSPRTLAPVHMVNPRPHIVLLGTGETVQNVNPALFGYLSRKGISLEVLTTVSFKRVQLFRVRTARRGVRAVGFALGVAFEIHARCGVREALGVTPALIGIVASPALGALSALCPSLCLNSPPPQAQAISTFNLLLGENRRVAAALISQNPMTRDDSCLYTKDAASLISRADVIRDAVLRSDVLPRDRLLTGGDAYEDTEREAQAAAVRYDEAVSAAAAAASLTVSMRTKSTPTASPVYGSPGGAAKDAPIVSTTPLAPRSVRPESSHQILDAVARNSGRKSGAK